MHSGHCKHHPSYAQDADSQDGDNSGKHHVSHAPQGAAHHFDADIGQESRCQELDHVFSQTDHFRVTAEHLTQHLSHGKDDGHHPQGKDGRNDQGLSHAAADPFQFSRPVVLPCEGHGSGAEGGNDHPEKGIHLVIDGPGCHHSCAEAIHSCLHKKIGQGVGGGLQGRRNTDPQYFSRKNGIKTDAPDL